MAYELKGKTVLVTGGTGSIGSVVVRQALTAGAARVISFSRDEIKQFLAVQEVDDERLVSVVGDVRVLESLERVFETQAIDVIFHAAAMKHLLVCEDEPWECAQTNILGTQNVVRLALRHGVERTIAVSTDKAAAPTSVMGATKLIAERVALHAQKWAKRGQAFAVVRFGNVANSRGSVLPVFAQRIRRRKPLWVSDPELTRFIMPIEEAARLVLEACRTTRGGELFILKMPAFRMQDLVDAAVAVGKVRRDAVRVTGLARGEKLHEDLIDPNEASHVLEGRGTYIITPGARAPRDYPGFRKATLTHYRSDTAPRIRAAALRAYLRQALRQGDGV